MAVRYYISLKTVLWWPCIIVKHLIYAFNFAGNELERALKSIKREDVVQKCMYNVEVIQDQVEMAAAKVAMDQSGK